jgi:hypothetical protein
MFVVGALAVQFYCVTALALSFPQRQVVQMTPCGLWLCPEHGHVHTHGLLLSAYSRDSRIMARALLEASTAAHSFREHNPRVPIAIITNESPTNLSSIFNYIVLVREDLLVDGKQRNGDYTPQWFTRLYYYAASPFSRTLGVDANVGFCDSVARQFQLLHKYDFVVPSQLRDGCTSRSFWPHNFAMGFVINSRTSYLFQIWALLQLQKGIPDDDQSTLHDAVHSAIKSVQLKFAVLESASAASFHHLQYPASIPGVTPILYSRIPIVHPVLQPTLAQVNLVCAAFNQPPRSKRRIAIMLSESKLQVAYSDEQCKEVTNASCKPACLGDQRWEWTATAGLSKELKS